MNVLPNRLTALVLIAGFSLATALTGWGTSASAHEASAEGSAASHEVVGPRTVDWSLLRTDKTIVLVQPTGTDVPCVAYTTKAEESARQVAITVIADDSGCAGDTSAQKSTPALPVKLDAPLGDRELVIGKSRI